MKRPILKFPSVIRTISDVELFFKCLVWCEGVSFHPDEPFSFYVDLKGRRTYSADEARVRDRLMSQSFEVCRRTGADIYKLACKADDWYLKQYRRLKSA